jgi:hypothetical protein
MGKNMRRSPIEKIATETLPSVIDSGSRRMIDVYSRHDASRLVAKDSSEKRNEPTRTKLQSRDTSY